MKGVYLMFLIFISWMLFAHSEKTEKKTVTPKIKTTKKVENVKAPITTKKATPEIKTKTTQNHHKTKTSKIPALKSPSLKPTLSQNKKA